MYIFAVTLIPREILYKKTQSIYTNMTQKEDFATSQEWLQTFKKTIWYSTLDCYQQVTLICRKFKTINPRQLFND